MATVGEMVFAEAAPFRPQGDDDNARTGVLMMVERLKSLGIWDAEVVEGRAQRTRATIEVPRNLLDKMDIANGQSIRLIVLPKEEE